MYTKNRFLFIFLFSLLLISFLLRVTTNIYSIGPDDSFRDYLITHHIIEYQEYPQTGPFAAVIKGRNSPSYYYLLSIILQLKDDPITLRVFTILLQLVTIFIIFDLAIRLFGLKTAIVASILFSFNSYSLYQSSFLWQPWIMQPFVNLSYLLLLISYQKKKYFFLLSSVFFFIFAGSLHLSVFALTPIFLVILFIILRKQKANVKHYAGALGVALSSFLALYFPVLLAYTKNSTVIPTLESSNIAGIYPLTFIAQNFVKNIAYFISGSFFNLRTATIPGSIFALVICLTLGYYFFSSKNKHERIHTQLIFFSILMLIFCLSIVHVKIFASYYGIHYFTPVYGLFIILLSRAFTSIFTKNTVKRILGILFLSIYLGYFLSNVYRVHYHGKSTFSLQHFSHPAIDAIRTDALYIKESEKYDNFNFFRLEIFRGGDKYGWQYVGTTWSILEKELQAKLVKLDDYNHDGFTAIAGNNPDYIFLVCPVITRNIDPQDECMNEFFRANKNYTNEKRTFSAPTYTIDLMKEVD